MEDKYQELRNNLPQLIVEANQKGGYNHRAQLIIDLLVERDMLANSLIWLILARQSFLLIRNLSNYRRGTQPPENIAYLNLQLIGDLSDALHNLPVNLSTDNSFLEDLIKDKIREFVQHNPQFKDYFKDII